MPKHKEKLDAKKVNFIESISFLMGFTQATVIYVISSFFKEAAGTENVGPFYFFSFLVVLGAILNLHKIVKKIGRANAFYFALLFKIIAIVFLINFGPTVMGIFVLMAYVIFSALEWVSMDLILESYSIDQMSGRIRGKHLALISAGFLLGPFLSAKILENYSFYGIFLLILALNSTILVISLIGLRSSNGSFKGNLVISDIFKKVRKRKNILRIYYVSFALDFFYALIVIYTPIYLLDLGLPWEKIGIIFTWMLVPFVLLQYPMGILADKKLGEKELLIFSIIVTGLSASVIFFISSTGIFIWSLVLFATRIGASILEVMRDSYFYKRIDADDVDLIDFFRTTNPVAFIAASAVSAVFLLFFPIKWIFLIVAAVVISAVFPAIRLQDNRCEKEMNENISK